MIIHNNNCIEVTRYCPAESTSSTLRTLFHYNYRLTASQNNIMNIQLGG